MEWSAEFHQGGEDLGCVLVAWPHPDIKVFRGADVPVGSQSMGSDYEILNGVSVERC